ncbi:MAG: cytidine deaminase [Clostridiales bacterium GWF2_38_85]|nr:MAG: cytidine deaminase [Clostridiales bacterium GWF2_38_85]HBL84778.1 cytidine deaminase [Clostridiales bacterium]
MERVSKENYYLDIAQSVAMRSTCLRRMYGAIIVKNDSIISTGYNGAPRGRVNCSDLKYCLREKMQIPRGERYELCRSIHSEANAIIAASREQMIDADLYMTCVDPKTNEVVSNVCSCQMCKRMIINSGIKRVIVRENATEYTTYEVQDWITEDDSLSGKSGY